MNSVLRNGIVATGSQMFFILQNENINHILNKI